jgi:hypothetical protein
MITRCDLVKLQVIISRGALSGCGGHCVMMKSISNVKKGTESEYDQRPLRDGTVENLSPVMASGSISPVSRTHDIKKLIKVNLMTIGIDGRVLTLYDYEESCPGRKEKMIL